MKREFKPRPRPPRDPNAPRAPARAARDAGAPRPPRGDAVTLDPDVARVFRSPAAVNRALRLVIQLAQLAAPAAGPSGTLHARPRRGGYQGSPQARGFTRRPRPDEDPTE